MSSDQMAKSYLDKALKGSKPNDADYKRALAKVTRAFKDLQGLRHR